VIGAVPDPGAGLPGRRLDQPRLVPRAPGLFVYTALGSRGITWSALGARLLAATMTGSPLPLESSLVDAVDPARFVSRQARRAGTR
jgi:tRNA 5-methylaminomethyl-2-thiouridine biosynthesis bifunctional protein